MSAIQKYSKLVSITLDTSFLENDHYPDFNSDSELKVTNIKIPHLPDFKVLYAKETIDRLFPHFKSLSLGFHMSSSQYLPIFSQNLTELQVLVNQESLSDLLNALPQKLILLQLYLQPGSFINKSMFGTIAETFKHVLSLSVTDYMGPDEAKSYPMKIPESHSGLQCLILKTNNPNKFLEHALEVSWPNLQCLDLFQRFNDKHLLIFKYVTRAMPNIHSLFFHGKHEFLERMLVSEDGLPKMKHLRHLDASLAVFRPRSELSATIQQLHSAKLCMLDQSGRMSNISGGHLGAVVFDNSQNPGIRFEIRDLELSIEDQHFIFSMTQCEWPKLSRLKITWLDEKKPPQNLPQLATRLPALRSVDFGEHLFEFLSEPD
eukprot:786758_1